jgi:hypothetical protein
MAEKYALYLPYKVLDSLASGNVTDSQFREFIMGLAEYDKSGTFPDSPTAGFAMMYKLLKPELDFAKAKYEDIVEKRREAGRKGGAPKGNRNAARNRGGGAPEGNRNAAKDNVPEQAPEPEPEKQTQAKQAKQAKQADNSNKITGNSYQYTDSDKFTTNISDAFASDVFFSETKIESFQNECGRVGYYIEQKRAKSLLKAYLGGFNNPTISCYETLFESNGFTEYVSTFIDTHKEYRRKPHEEKLKLFLSLMTSSDLYNKYVDGNP